jgi:hypothetical protein
VHRRRLAARSLVSRGRPSRRDVERSCDLRLKPISAA